MKLPSALVWLALLGTAAAAEKWPDTLTGSAGSFAPLRTLKAHFRFGWAMVSAAEADFQYTRTGNAGRLMLTTRTIGMARGLWRIDAKHDARLLLSPLHAVSTYDSETEKDGTEVTQLTFTPEAVSRYREQQPPGKDPPKTKTFEFPGVMDLHTALHFIRSQRLAQGDKYRLVAYPNSAPYLAEVEVVERETLKLPIGNKPAIKMSLKLWKIGKDLKLEPHPKFKRGSAWIADDADRMFLRIESELAVGSVWGEVDKLEFP